MKNLRNGKIESDLILTIYNKGGQTWYCDYYFYNGLNYEQGTTKASGYGYDKQSTAASEAINKFNMLYNIKQGTKWEYNGSMRAITKNNKSYYGIYPDKNISYGIGLSSVLNCIGVLSNVKIKLQYFGEKETKIHLQIKNTEKQIQKELEKNQKKIENKKTSKEDKKELKAINQRIIELFKMEDLTNEK